MNTNNHGHLSNISDIDSFYNSRIAAYITEEKILTELDTIFLQEQFDNYRLYNDINHFINRTNKKKHDLIIFNLSCNIQDEYDYDLVENLRKNDSDVAIITFGMYRKNNKKHLELNISYHFMLPISIDDLMRACKKALGIKISHDIGMQFFDALFGMQMCTHRDLHQRTFDHVIRTTKIYTKFLLHLMNIGYIKITSWILKNLIMASMLHDIGKLLVMHGVLYKEGKLTEFEYEQVRRHPWYSITALLGGQDIDFYSKFIHPIETVSGYKERNLGDQTQDWIFKILENDLSAMYDVDTFFSDMIQKPSVHSLNKDLLYIIYRHHDTLNNPYNSVEDLMKFGKIISREIQPELSENFFLDIVANALSICDMYDALLDLKRDYRSSTYSKFFALFLLYYEMKSKKFFQKITEEFIKLIISSDILNKGELFYAIKDEETVLKAIENIYNVFSIDRSQEWEFSKFIELRHEEFERYAVDEYCEGLMQLNEEWKNYYGIQKDLLQTDFIGILIKANLLEESFSLHDLHNDDKQIEIFNVLCKFYYGYSSKYKQNMVINYLTNQVIDDELTGDVKMNINTIIKDRNLNSKRDFERLLIDLGYRKQNLFETFKNYNEEILINEFNDFLRRH